MENGKYFKCENFIKISSKQMGESKTVHSFKTTSIVKHELYRCYWFFSVKYKRQFYHMNKFLQDIHNLLNIVDD